LRYLPDFPSVIAAFSAKNVMFKMVLAGTANGLFAIIATPGGQAIGMIFARLLLPCHNNLF